MTPRTRGFALPLALAFVAGVGWGCTPTGVDEVDRELANAKKNATKRKPAECYPESQEPCYWVKPDEPGDEATANRGICKVGERQCDKEGFWLECKGAVLPATEVCNGIDDDCNGKVDDGFDREGAKCFAGEGECRVSGTYSCSADGGESVCSAKAKKGTPEVCDNRDNDCNGKIDDGDIKGTGSSCSTGQRGACSAGTKRCVGGEVKCMPNHTRTVEICKNSLDDDCDGQADEDDDCMTEKDARAQGLIK